MDLSISIVNFNTKEPLKKCLESIKNNIQGISYEVIVVDNASSDGSAEMVKQGFPHIKLIANSQNRGATVAKNQSFKIAQGRFILIADSDIEILPGAVSSMVDFMDKTPQAGIVGPRVLFADLSPQHSCNKGFPNLFNAFINNIFFLAHLRYRFYRTTIGKRYVKSRYNRVEEFAWLGGMCLLVRNTIVQQLGGMDENFFIYYDDTEFCLRVKKAGYKIYYLPQAAVIHYWGAGVGKFSAFLFPKIFESELYFFRKHHGRFQKKVCAFFIQLSMLLRFVIAVPLFFLRIKRDYFKQRFSAYGEVLRLAGKRYGKTD